MKNMLETLIKAKSKKNNKGFTLIELVVVIAIIAVLVTLIAPNLIGYLGQARTTKGEAAAKSVYTAIVAKHAVEPITSTDGDTNVTITEGAIAKYFNQSEVVDITGGTIVAHVSGGTVEAVKVDFDNGTTFYYPKGTESSFTAAPDPEGP